MSVTDTTPEIRIAVVIVTANSRNSRPRMPLMNRIGMNTAASDTVIVTIVKPISFEPLSAASSGASPVLHVPDDVLEHHDRVVDDEADREDERHHRQVVEAEAEHCHHGERAENRERQRERRNERRRAAVQEREDDADDEHERDEHRPLDVAERLADVASTGRRGSSGAPTAAAAPRRTAAARGSRR